MPGDRKDDYTLMCIRKAMIDACWSRAAASTVEGNARRLVLDYKMAFIMLSIDKPLPKLRNSKIED